MIKQKFLLLRQIVTMERKLEQSLVERKRKDETERMGLNSAQFTSVFTKVAAEASLTYRNK